MWLHGDVLGVRVPAQQAKLNQSDGAALWTHYLVIYSIMSMRIGMDSVERYTLLAADAFPS